MKKLLALISIFSLFIISFQGCEDRSELTAPEVNTGNADLTKIVVIGNSLAAGVQNGTLYKEGQEYSYGNLIARQLGMELNAPYFQSPGLPAGAPGRIEAASIEPFSTTYNMTQVSTTPLTAGPYQNLGVPGALLYDALNATSSTTCFSYVFGGSPNPLFDAILQGNGTQFQQARAQNPSLVLFWMGNNDILGHATSGGIVPFTPPTPVAQFPVDFQTMYLQACDSLATLNADVIVANIPDVSVIPFFTTVGGQFYQQGITSFYGVRHSTGQAEALSPLENFILLPAQTLLTDADGNPTGLGVLPQLPIPDSLLLDYEEIATITQVVTAYNQIIQTAATNYNFGFVDIAGELGRIKAAEQSGGYEVNGLTFTTYFVLGGVFSLDGVHPTNQGYGIIANQFIKVINSRFNADIPLVNVTTLPSSIILSGQ